MNPSIATQTIYTKEIKKQNLWLNAWKRLKRNKLAMAGMVILTFMALIAVFAPAIAPYGFDDQSIARAYKFPSKEYLMGTDNLGRDIFSRIVYGSRISLRLGFVSVAISMVAGIFIGSVAGYYGGKSDNLIMRVMDVIQSIPSMLLAITIAAALGPGMTNAMIAIGFAGIPGYARIVRGSILTIRESEFIEAARAIGASDARIIAKHILPNVLSPILVQATLGIAGAIITAAALSFIGLGAQPPTPEWGAMIAGGRNYIQKYWHLVTFPGLAIMLTVVSFNLVGDGIRDALDPRLSR